MNRRAKVAIIGAGTAGLAALAAVREETDDVVLVERGPLGTTCARVGCMPSKLLIAAADAADAVRRAPEFGVAAEPVVDGRAVMARVRRMRDEFVAGVVRRIEGLPEGMLLKGEARLDGDALLIRTDGGEERLEAERIVVATGSRPAVPPPFRGIAVTSDDVFDWDDLPPSAAVFGAGSVGLELAVALARLGVRVRLFGKDGDIGGLSDPALRSAAWETIGPLVDAVPDHELLALTGDGEGATVEYGADGGRFSATFARIVVAVGRGPASPLGGAEEVDPLTRGESGRPVFVAGDAAGDRPLLHEASWSGTRAGVNALRWPDVVAAGRQPFLAVTFSRPEIAVVGESHAALVDRGAAFAVGAADFSDQGRAKVEGRAAGRLHLYGEAGSGRLLGAEMVAPGAEHLAHLVAFALAEGLTADRLAHMPFYHPTVEEGLRTAACALAAEAGRPLAGGAGPARYGPGG